jgi:hypothetical protein
MARYGNCKDRFDVLLYASVNALASIQNSNSVSEIDAEMTHLRAVVEQMPQGKVMLYDAEHPDSSSSAPVLNDPVVSIGQGTSKIVITEDDILPIHADDGGVPF